MLTFSISPLGFPVAARGAIHWLCPFGRPSARFVSPIKLTHPVACPPFNHWCASAGSPIVVATARVCLWLRPTSRGRPLQWAASENCRGASEIPRRDSDDVSTARAHSPACARANFTGKTSSAAANNITIAPRPPPIIAALSGAHNLAPFYQGVNRRVCDANRTLLREFRRCEQK